MSQWVPITRQTLYDSKIAALVDACDTAALANGQTNRADGIIQSVVEYIRRKVASWQRNLLDQDVTRIPQGLQTMASDMIMARLKIAIEMELSEDERRQLRRHEVDLDAIAAGQNVVDQPDNPIAAPMQPVVPSPAFGCPPRREFNRYTQEG